MYIKKNILLPTGVVADHLTLLNSFNVSIVEGGYSVVGKLQLHKDEQACCDNCLSLHNYNFAVIVGELSEAAILQAIIDRYSTAEYRLDGHSLEGATLSTGHEIE